MGNKECLYEQRKSRKEEGACVAPTVEMNGLASLKANFGLIVQDVMGLSIPDQRVKRITQIES
jgi:hypothetical protein